MGISSLNSAILYNVSLYFVLQFLRIAQDDRLRCHFKRSQGITQI